MLKQSQVQKRHVTLKHVVVKTVVELRKSYFVWRYSTICLSLYALAKQTGFLAPGRRYVPHLKADCAVNAFYVVIKLGQMAVIVYSLLRSPLS